MVCVCVVCVVRVSLLVLGKGGENMLSRVCSASVPSLSKTRGRESKRKENKGCQLENIQKRKNGKREREKRERERKRERENFLKRL